MAQQGFVYEENAYKALLEYNIAAGGPPAGAAHDRPDLEIKPSKDQHDRNKTGVELKISPTAAGSLVLKYKDGKWYFDDNTKGDPEKEFLIALAKEYKVLENMNTSGLAGRNWRGKVPYLQNDDRGKKVIVGAKDSREAYEKDLKQFGGQNEVHIDINPKSIGDYYNKKKTYYMNVGTHGFYTLNSDPLDLNKKIRGSQIPDFRNSVRARIRVRVQYKGSGSYQFVFTLEFKSPKKSPYNLAPVTSSGNVNIDMGKLESTQNQPLLEALRL